MVIVSRQVDYSCYTHKQVATHRNHKRKKGRQEGNNVRQKLQQELQREDQNFKKYSKNYRNKTKTLGNTAEITKIRPKL